MHDMDARALAHRIVRDVLAERGPDGVTPFRMFAVDPDDMPLHRKVLAQRYAHLVPAGVTLDDVPRVAAAIVPFLVGRAT
jgi:hypothetical protein